MDRFGAVASSQQGVRFSIIEPVMKYKVVLQQSEEGFSVSCPGLPGCWSQGKTEQEALENIQDAIREYLQAVSDSLRDANVREIEVTV
jgi:predicted RNase H-like HicB family nuclease